VTATRKWTAGGALAIVAILVLTWFVLVAPKRGEVTELRADTEAQEGTNQTLLTQVNVLKAENKKLPKYQSELAAYQRRIPSTSAMPSLIRALNDAAVNAGVNMTSVTPSPAVALTATEAEAVVAPVEGSLPPGALAGINVEIVVTGGYFEVQQFVNKLENLERYVQIGTLAIAEPDDAATTDPETAGTENDLSATLTARTYLVPPAAAATTVDSAASTTESQE